MRLLFLQRELKKETLDRDALLLPYLMAVCLQAPKLWVQFKRMIKMAEQLAEREQEEEGDTE